jgi:Retrotransposon gag protein
MRRHSDKSTLVPLDPEIEATVRRLNKERRRREAESALRSKLSSERKRREAESSGDRVNTTASDPPSSTIEIEFSSESSPSSSATSSPRASPPPSPRMALLGELGVPSPQDVETTCIVLPEIDVQNFELRYPLIQFIEKNQFSGLPTESPHDHLSDFLTKCNTIRIAGVTQEYIKLALFPFSLRDRAKSWLLSEPPNKYTTWNGLAQGFLTKFYPPNKTSEMRSKIQSFKQSPFETYYEAWERYKELLRACPHHDIPKWLLIQTFY